MKMRHLLGILAVCVGVVGGSVAASAQEYFGKNKVNYSNYDWHFIETEHFTIYFDQDAFPVAEFTAKEAERSLVQIEKDLKYTLKGRYPVVIYNSHNGFSVSNITPYEQSEFTGGFTEFSQGRVVIPYTGSYADFRHVIHHELVHAVTVELWTGGGWMGALMSQTASLPPLWVAEGLAEYLSQFGWDKNADNLMRDATITGYVPPIEFIYGGLFAYKGGQSIFYMVEEESGKDKVAEFVSALRTAKTPDRALKSSLGYGTEELNEKWQLWLKRQYWNEINLHTSPAEVAKNLTEHRKAGSLYNLAPTFSPQGDKIVYLTDKRNTFDIEMISAIDGKELGRLVQGERSSDFESMFVLRPGLTWSPDGRQIAFAAKSNNKNTLYTLDVRKRKVLKRFKFDLDGMFEPTWSPDGKQIAVVGLKNGWSDIYVVDLQSESLKRITEDPYDERHIHWSPDGKWLSMSSDRPDTVLAFDGVRDFPFGQYDVFVIRPDGSAVRRVVTHDAEESHPVWGPDSKQLAFISDRTGVGNVYVANLDSSEVFPVTNLLSSAQYIDWSSDGKKLVFTTFHEAGYDVFVMKDPLSKRKKVEDLPLTRHEMRRRGIEEKPFVVQQLERQEAQEDSVKQAKAPKVEPLVADEPDTAVTERKVEKWVSDQMALAAVEAKESEKEKNGENGASADADSSDSESRGRRVKDWTDKEFKVHKYKIKFKPELFAANAGFDTFYGVSSLVQLSMSDVMGDHRAVLLTNLQFSLKDSDLFLSYAYLKRQTNYFGELFHTRLYFFDGGVLNADRYYGFGGGLERPFNRFSRFEFGMRGITIDRERLNTFNDPFVRGGFVGGPGRGVSGVNIATERALITEAALVDDTTMQSLFGPVSGRRARLGFEGSPAGMEYLSVQLDYRKYALVLEQYTFAFRVSGGTSFGPNSQVFFVGGVNNPVNPRFSTIADVNTNRLFFSSFVWPLRGAELFELAGDSYMLANVAFRFPLFRQLAMGWPLPLFFQNIQGELFLDVGGAFNRDNFDPWEYRDGGFELYVPQTAGRGGRPSTPQMAAGYGLGARVNLGIFLFRYDLAWPTNLAETFHPVQYFSIDFTGMF